MHQFNRRGLYLRVPPPVVFFIAAGLTWLLSNQWPVYTSDSIWLIVLAAIFALLSAACALSSLWEFYRHETTVDPHAPHQTSVLISRGIYAYTRNPMYLSLLLGLAALQAWWGALSGWIVLPLFVFYMNRYQIAPEEHVLTYKFGDHFHDYISRSRRWF